MHLEAQTHLEYNETLDLIPYLSRTKSYLAEVVVILCTTYVYIHLSHRHLTVSLILYTI